MDLRWTRAEAEEFFHDNDGGFFVQGLVVVAAFWRLDATGTAFLARAFDDSMVGSFPEVFY